MSSEPPPQTPPEAGQRITPPEAGQRITPPAERRRARLPGLLPVLYFGFAHLSLAIAFGEVALEPQKVAGFFYHPRMIAVVHLVTLGWISGSILGALHLVGPMALRVPMPARRIDYWAFIAYVLSSAGVISHFWIEEFTGVAWSGLLITAVFMHVGRKFLTALESSPVHREVKLHFVLAFANIGLAALAGTLLGLNKHLPFLPGRALTQAYAHAHLAALGWATMMVFAAGYRLLPMLLPAAMPHGAWVWAGAVLLELGTLGLFVSLFTESRLVALAAVCAAAGVGVFLSRLLWMRRHLRPPPKGRIRPDLGVAQVLAALAYSGLTCVLGLILAWSPETTEQTLRLAAVYGVCGLIGFLSQMIVGVSARLLPIFARLVAADWCDFPPTPHEMPDRRLQAATFVLWTLGVPVLAAGFWFDRTWIVGAGGGVLLAGVAASAASLLVVMRAARGSASTAGSPVNGPISASKGTACSRDPLRKLSATPRARNRRV